VPIDGVVPKAWLDGVVEAGTGRVERIPYELCVLIALREALRRREVYVCRRQRPGRLPRLVVRRGDDCLRGNVIIALVTGRCTSDVVAGGVIGRDGELGYVAALLAQLEDGPAALVFAGEPGIGKTTVSLAAAGRARASSAVVLAAHPVEAEAELGFAALADLLAPVVDELLPALPEPQRHALAVVLLLEEPGRRPLDQRAVCAATLSGLRMAATRGPVVLAIDDLQWLDASSARVLDFALRLWVPRTSSTSCDQPVFVDHAIDASVRRRRHPDRALQRPDTPDERDHRTPGCRRELLDRALVWNQAHLRRILHEYEIHHNQHRPHRSLHGAAPLKPLPEPVDLGQYRVRRQTRISGLISEYRLVA
jgi:hypothetical protein